MAKSRESNKSTANSVSTDRMASSKRVTVSSSPAVISKAILRHPRDILLKATNSKATPNRVATLLRATSSKATLHREDIPHKEATPHNKGTIHNKAGTHSSSTLSSSKVIL